MFDLKAELDAMKAARAHFVEALEAAVPATKAPTENGIAKLDATIAKLATVVESNVELVITDAKIVKAEVVPASTEPVPTT
jgi:hypothetical protein